MSFSLIRSVFILSCLLAIAGCGGSYEPTSRTALIQEFTDEFNVPPSLRITEIRCRIVRVGDSWSKWMMFTMDEPIFQKIVENGFSAAGTKERNDSHIELWEQDIKEMNPNEPKWWRRPDNSQERVYYREPNRSDFGGSSMYIWVDSKSGMVYSKSSAWD